MRLRLFILIVLVAIVAAAAAASRSGARLDCASLQDIGQRNPASACVATLSPEAQLKWWAARRALPLGVDRKEVDALEACSKIGDIDEAGRACAELLRKLGGSETNFQSTYFRGGDLGGRDFNFAMLRYATFDGVDLAAARIESSIVADATFRLSNLSRVSFRDSDLRHAVFDEATLTDARFDGADLNSAEWDPRPGTLPNMASLASARNLHGLRYRKTSQQLAELREALYKAGLPEQARQVTFAIERTGRTAETGSDDVARKIGGWLRYAAFEKTVGYGMYPFRPLLLILLLIPLFTPVYFAAAWWRDGGRLWIRRSDGAIGRDAPTEWRPVARMVNGGWDAGAARSLLHAFWFSVMCAFRFGYRDVNVGDWITRLQPSEFLLGATGWCRTVAGVQSLLSVYLLALTVLCLIGRPFG